MTVVWAFIKARWPFFAGGVAIGLVIVLLATCHRDNGAGKQAEQTTRSGDAMSNAAANAIDTLQNRTATDDTINAATDNAMKEIGNAQSPDDVRSAVLAGVCASASHRSDPACRVQ